MKTVTDLEDFAIFILTFGRPKKQHTYRRLMRDGYTGRIYFVCSDEDETLPVYLELYGDQVIVFSKKDYEEAVDLGDNFTSRRTVLYARNACYDIAKKLGITYFAQMDDDYTTFSYKFDGKLRYKQVGCKRLDEIFKAVLTFYINTPIDVFAFAQGGDFMGGSRSRMSKTIQLKRKAMNTMFCSVDRQVPYVARLNDDVTSYVIGGIRGRLFMQTNQFMIVQNMTQAKKGGMTEAYLELGTYLKSFYSIIFAPSCVKIFQLGRTEKRLHHHILWNNAVPKIIRE